MKGCETCKFLSRSTDHLETEYLKEQVKKDRDVYTCLSGRQFSETWAFGNLWRYQGDSLCGGESYQPRKRIKEYWFNRSGICLNPKTTVVADSKKYMFSFSVCQRRKSWYWSVHYQRKGTSTGCGGGGFAPGPGSLRDGTNELRTACPNEQSAIFKSAKFLLTEVNGYKEDKELKKVKESLMQLIEANEPPKTTTIKGYPGNKGADGVYHRIINLFPPHDHYYELFLGSGQILCRKKPARGLNLGVEINPSTIEKFKGYYPKHASIHQADAIWFLRSKLVANPETLIYLDPPYPMNSRRSTAAIYNYEMTDDQHRELLGLLKDCKAMVAISSYENALYNEMLPGWYKTKFKAATRGGVAWECVYHNYPVPERLHQYDYLGKDRTDRQRISRKITRWAERLAGLPSQERNAILDKLLQYGQK